MRWAMVCVEFEFSIGFSIVVLVVFFFQLFLYCTDSAPMEERGDLWDEKMSGETIKNILQWKRGSRSNFVSMVRAPMAQAPRTIPPWRLLPCADQHMGDAGEGT